MKQQLHHVVLYWENKEIAHAPSLDSRIRGNDGHKYENLPKIGIKKP